PICWAYTDLYLWKAAVEKAQSFEVKDVIAALSDMEISSPAGVVKMHTDNHHLAKYAVIGEILEDGQFEVLSRTDELVIPEPFSEFSK
ncbi:MAG: transporter substrate-binding protein, partial [Rikenellaceae bacterium]